MEENKSLEMELDSLYEQMLFTPCKSKSELKQWIKTFLGIPVPDCTIDKNSNSNPMNFIWDVYECALTGRTDYTTFVVAASRNSCKTLSAAILEFLLMLHFGRSIVHLAAILDQSTACINYLNRYLGIPAVKKYSDTDNKRVKFLKNMPMNLYKPVDSSRLLVLVANRESANAQHASCLVYDEVDLIDKHVLSESAMIGDPFYGKPPIFIYLSSRKTATGPVQEKIDQSMDPANGVRLHKWSTMDFMKKCPEEVHQPQLPKSNIYIHKESLFIRRDEELAQDTGTDKELYDQHEVYAGCVRCPALLACQGQAPRQESDSVILRDIPFIRTVLRETGDPEQIKAQILNLKPESSGTVFNKFNREIHVKSPEEAFKFAFGIDIPFINKHTLVSMLKENDWRLTCGVDFGYVDPAAAVLVAYHRAFDKIIILHCEMAAGFSNPDWLIYVKRNIYDVFGFDLCCPDTADKSSPGVASKLGMPARSKKPMKIETGVAWLRSRMWSPAKQDYSLIVLRDPSTIGIIEAFERWQYKRGPMGFLYGEFEDDTMPTHTLDACRYAIDPYVMTGIANYAANLPPKPRLLTGEEASEELTRVELATQTKQGFFNAMREEYQHLYGIDVEFSKDKTDNNKDSGNRTVRAGNFVFSFD